MILLTNLYRVSQCIGNDFTQIPRSIFNLVGYLNTYLIRIDYYSTIVTTISNSIGMIVIILRSTP